MAVPGSAPRLSCRLGVFPNFLLFFFTAFVFRWSSFLFLAFSCPFWLRSGLIYCISSGVHVIFIDFTAVQGKEEIKRTIFFFHFFLFAPVVQNYFMRTSKCQWELRSKENAEVKKWRLLRTEIHFRPFCFVFIQIDTLIRGFVIDIISLFEYFINVLS